MIDSKRSNKILLTNQDGQGSRVKLKKTLSQLFYSLILYAPLLNLHPYLYSLIFSYILLNLHPYLLNRSQENGSELIEFIF